LKVLTASLCISGCTSAQTLNASQAAQTQAAQTPDAKILSGTSDQAELWFGGSGTTPGRFLELHDLTFDAQNNLWTLDGSNQNYTTKAREGNLRVQKFSTDGKLLLTFAIRDEDLGVEAGSLKNNPQRIAVDGAGNVYITQPDMGVVQQFAPDGKLVANIPVPHAMAISVWQSGGEKIAVATGRQEIVNSHWADVGGEQIDVLNPADVAGRAATMGTPIKLDRKLQTVSDLATDRTGNLYVQAAQNAIYKFSPQGQLLKTFGSNTEMRAEDGSELRHTVTVDSKGNLYSVTFGNPGRITRYDADGKTVTQREGQWKWADAWSAASGYVILQEDKNDRLWVGVVNKQDPKGPNFATYNPSPAVALTKADFFSAPANAVRQIAVATLGFKADVETSLPYNIAYVAGQIPLSFVVAPANRQVQNVDVAWRVQDVAGKEVSKGALQMPLKDGAEARGDFAFRAPQFGSYFVTADVSSGGQALASYGAHIGVTPQFPNTKTLVAGESKGGWEDVPRQMFSGVVNMRFQPGKDLDKAFADAGRAQQAGITYFLQVTDNPKATTPEKVREIAARFKGKNPIYEVANEPNFTFNVEDYAKFHRMVYDNIKAVDPAAKVMGPATVDLNLGWLRRFYELGGKDMTDAISLHDYEGHESIDPVHWRWKYGEVRKIMALNGDAAKPLWQTERALAGVRGNDFQGLVQAIRTTLHYDLLETLGIPAEHNNLYYLNEGGYADVPTYVWSSNGPHPAALALRTRYALTSAMGRKYAGTLDFGPTGNSYLMGVRFSGPDGTTLALRNLGTPDVPLSFGVQGARVLDVVDSWGNVSRVPVVRGQAQLVISQLPIYVRLAAGQALTAPKIDFGRNIAPQATFKYSSTVKQDNALLNNGVIETYQAGDPNGDTNGDKIWTGDLPAFPQTLDINLDHAQPVSQVIVRGVRADNGFCALLSYDLQAWDGAAWKTIQQVRRPMAPSQPAMTVNATHTIWMDDTNVFVHQFAPITTSRLRLVVNDVTHGFVPDDRAKAWGSVIPQKLMLREIEIYNAPAPR